MMKKENHMSITTTVPLAAYVGIGIAVFCWGVSFASMRIVVSELNPLVGVWARILLGMPVLLFAVLRRNELRSPSKKEWPILLFMGFLGILWHQGIQFWGMRTAGVANANWMIAGTPALVALMGWFFLKEKLSTSGIVGLGISAFWSSPRGRTRNTREQPLQALRLLKTGGFFNDPVLFQLGSFSDSFA
jgi:EamA-like transporter family.